MILSADGSQRLLFIEVPHAKQVKTVCTWTSCLRRVPATNS